MCEVFIIPSGIFGILCYSFLGLFAQHLSSALVLAAIWPGLCLATQDWQSCHTQWGKKNEKSDLAKSFFSLQMTFPRNWLGKSL